MKKKEILIVLVVFLVLVLALTVAKLTGYAVSTDESISKVVFYKTLRAEINPDYLSSCFPKSEVMPIIPDAKCCEGLQAVGVIDESLDRCDFVSGVILCTDCGNSLCEFGENNCNCDSDCN